MWRKGKKIYISEKNDLGIRDERKKKIYRRMHFIRLLVHVRRSFN